MKFRLLAFALLLSGGVSAQNPYISLQGANETAGGLTVAQPRTILAVDVTVEHDVTLSGPYARYAQKYLGVRAPLTDKTVWSVTGAQIALLDGDTYLNAAAPAPASTRVLSHTASENEFARLQPDKTDMTTPALEDAARTAAAQIFSLRRHRIELVTGEAGENVFGEGLKAALEEIDRLEQSYLELFLGKRIVSTETRRYVVCPQADKKQYIVCRFSPAAGLLPDTDLSGDIVLLQIEPSGVAKSDLEAGPRRRRSWRAAWPIPRPASSSREAASMPAPCFLFSNSAVRSTSPCRAANNLPMDFTSRMAALLGAFRRERNGAVADSMRFYGAPCGLNYGVSLPTLRTLARAEAADHDFAKYLWRQDVRCLRLAALHIADPARLTPGEFAFWGDGLLNSEIAAEAAFALLSRIGAFPELFAAWIAPDAGWLRQYAALMAAARVPHPSPAWAVPAAAVVHGAAAASIPEAHLLAHGAVALFTALGTRNEENRQAVLRAAGSLGQLPAEACVHEELAWRLEV